MTNFERYIDELTQDKFIDSMILNCDVCPVDDCDMDGEIALGNECEEMLKNWCESEKE